MQIIKNIIVRIFTIIFNFYCNKKGIKKNIVIISFKFLGDTVFTIPAIRYIKKAIPNQKILILCYESNKLVYELEFSDIQYIVYDKRDLDLENRNPNFKFLKTLTDIKSFKPEYLFDFTSNYKTALLSFLSRTKNSCGFGNNFLAGFYNSFNSESPKSAFEIFLNPVKDLDETLDYKDFIYFNINFLPSNKILFMPSAGWAAKEWNKQSFIKLIQMISNNYNSKIISEPNFFSDDLVNYLSDNKINYIQTTNLRELISEINSSSVIVSNDTGPIYISALLGHPTYTIFGPTGPLFHGIKEYHHQYIRKELKCSPKLSEKLCFTFGGRVGCPSNECMQLLDVDEVYNDLLIFLNKLNISKS